MSGHGFLEKRWLRLDKLDTPVRRVILTTFTVLVALALAILIRKDIAGPELPNFALWIFHRNIFLIAALISSVGAWLLLAGAARAQTRWRYLLIAPVLFAILLTAMAGPHIFANVPASYRWLSLLPAPFIIASLVLVWCGPGLKTTTILLASLATVTLFVSAIAVATLTLHPAYGPTVFTVIMMAGVCAMAPAILVTGFDLAEIGSETAAYGLKFLSARPRLAAIARWTLPVLGAAVAFLTIRIMGYHVPDALKWTALWAGLLVLAAVLAGAVMRRWPTAAPEGHGEIGYLQVLCVAIAVTISMFAGLWFTEPRPGYLNYDGARHFSLRAPEGMQQLSVRLAESRIDPNWTFVRFATNKHPPTLAIVAVPRAASTPSPQPRDLKQLIGISRGPQIPIRLEKEADNGWRHGRATMATAKAQYQFRFYKREDLAGGGKAAADWYIVCGGAAADAKKVESLCQEARGTFYVGFSRGSRDSRPVAMLLCGLFLAASTATLAWTTWRSRNGHDSRVLDFAVWAFILTAARWSAGFMWDGIDAPLDNLKIAADLLGALAAVIAVGAAVLSLRQGPKADHITGQAVGGMIMLAAIFYLYVFAIELSEYSQLIRALIIILALIWELATAGLSLNPTDEAHVFPHTSRVLIFVGYLILVGAAAFVFMESRTTNGARVAALDTEAIVANGIVTLGGALIISRAIHALARLRQESEAAA